MSLSDKIAPELPYLRRFARAITGSQKIGDALVVAMLEALLADNSLFPQNMPSKMAAYATFLKILETQHQTEIGVGSEAAPLIAHDRHLNSISYRPRQAFLLVSVEGFRPETAALVMGISEDNVRELIDLAGREIAEQVATKVLIIEDEPLIALDLWDIVKSIGHDVCATASTRAAAVAAFATHKPGMVLADIQLADGSSGLEAINEILGSFEVPVVFITAYPERLLTGKRPEPTFLINKPFQAATVKAIISQALFFDSRATKAAA